MTKAKSTIDLDAADRRIQRVLQRDGRIAVTALAEEVASAFHKALAAREEVLAAWAMSGDMDYMLHVVAEDFDAYAEFALKALLRMPGVKETRSSFVLTALKPPGAVPV